MLIDQLNLNQLRVFVAVYAHRSMTIAAKELHLTQSGVSQHMKALEDMLEVKLFDRINQRLVPTATATQLYDRCNESLIGIETILAEVKGKPGEVQGLVKIGLPIEFGNSIVMPMLAKIGRKYPKIRFEIELNLASVMNERLVAGDMDFACIDDFKMDSRIEVEKVFDENWELCGRQDLVKSFGVPRNQKKYFELLPYIAYQKDEPVLRQWFHHHLKSRHINLDVRATVMDVQGVARLITEGMGVGVLPDYILSRLKKDGHSLHRFKGTGQFVKNAISLCYLRDRTQSPGVQIVLQDLQSQLIARQ